MKCDDDKTDKKGHSKVIGVIIMPLQTNLWMISGTGKLPSV